MTVSLATGLLYKREQNRTSKYGRLGLGDFSWVYEHDFMNYVQNIFAVLCQMHRRRVRSKWVGYKKNSISLNQKCLQLYQEKKQCQLNDDTSSSYHIEFEF